MITPEGRAELRRGADDEPTDDELAAGIDEAEAELEAEQRPWTSLPLITAGGYTWVLEVPNGASRWRRLGAAGPTLPGMSDDDIADLGEVREAVVVTLPAAIGQYAQGVFAQLGPDLTRTTAAELLAAVRESGAS